MQCRYNALSVSPPSPLLCSYNTFVYLRFRLLQNYRRLSILSRVVHHAKENALLGTLLQDHALLSRPLQDSSTIVESLLIPTDHCLALEIVILGKKKIRLLPATLSECLSVCRRFDILFFSHTFKSLLVLPSKLKWVQCNLVFIYIWKIYCQI